MSTEPTEPETVEQARKRYLAAAHGMQTGVATKMHYDPAHTAPKHLRVGVNSAMAEHSGLAQLLMDKGVITEAEYTVAMADAMERERDLYQREIEERFGPDGPKITLG